MLWQRMVRWVCGMLRKSSECDKQVVLLYPMSCVHSYSTWR